MIVIIDEECKDLKNLGSFSDACIESKVLFEVRGYRLYPEFKSEEQKNIFKKHWTPITCYEVPSYINYFKEYKPMVKIKLGELV